MTPKNGRSSVFETAEDKPTGVAAQATVTEEEKQVPLEIRWRNVFLFSLLHLGALYGLYLLPYARPYTWLFGFTLHMFNGLGITAGAHRLWTHRCYRAKLPLKIFLAMCSSLAFQNDIIEWSRDHRMHHKYSETNADPHNAKRGFFFAHCGWLMVRKHPDVKEKGKNIDMSDLLNDPVCAIQRKFYLPSVLLFCFILPTIVPWYFWNESLWIAYFVPGILRYVGMLHCTWLVNSAAHMWGNRPYDLNIDPAENLLVTIGAVGEGFHNYHHVFPSDYSASEYGWHLNPTTMFIDFMAFIGQVDQRKKMSPEAVAHRRKRTGDGSDGFGYLLTDTETLRKRTVLWTEDITALKSSAKGY